MSVGRTQAPTCRCGRRTRRAELLVDDELLDQAGVATHGAGHGGDVAGLGDEAVPVGPVLLLQVVQEAADRGSVLVRLGGQVERERATSSSGGERRHPGPPSRRATEQLANGERPLQVQVGVVLPGEPDSPVDLHAVLGAAGERLGHDGPAHRR